MMKKLVISLFILFTLVFALVVGDGTKLSAASAPTMIDGASIRTQGNQGIKFSANSDDLGDEHGFFVALGEHDKNAIATAVAAESNTVGGKDLLNLL